MSQQATAGGPQSRLNERPLPKRRRLHEVKRQLKKNWMLYVIIFPPVVYFLIWHYWPLYGVQIAFKDFMPGKGIIGSPWVGFDHFERYFNSFYFWRLIKNTIGISLYGLLVGIPLPIILALMFHELRFKRIRGLAQTISYAPNFISVVVAGGIILFFIRPETGVLNAVIKAFGGESINFLADPKYFWHIIVWSDVWQGVGWGSLIYYAAMSGISPDQYEAAYLDGANKLQRIWNVTLPNILPTIVIISILSMGNILNVGFEKILLLQTGTNASASEVISTYVYKSGIQGAQYSFSAAIGLFNNAVTFILLVIVNAFARRVGSTSLW